MPARPAPNFFNAPRRVTETLGQFIEFVVHNFPFVVLSGLSFHWRDAPRES